MKNWIVVAFFFIYLNGCLFGGFYNPSAWYVPALWVNFWIVGILGAAWGIYRFVMMMDKNYLW